jgi:hypothetical protein
MSPKTAKTPKFLKFEKEISNKAFPLANRLGNPVMQIYLAKEKRKDHI